MVKTSLIGDKVQIRCVLVILGLMPIFAIAGGRGIPLLVAIGGALWLWYSARNAIRTQKPGEAFLDFMSRQPQWIWGLAAFLFWACLSTFWSTYESPKLLNNAFIVTFGAILYFAFQRQIGFAIARRPALMKKFILGITVFLLFILFWDISTHYGLSLFFDPLGDTEPPEKKQLDLIQNTSNGISTLALCLPAALTMIWTQSRRGKWIAGLTALAALYTAYLGQMDSVVIVMILAIIVMGLARVWPVLMTKLVIFAAMLSWVAAPILGHIITRLPQAQQSTLPQSWEHRAKIWAFVAQKITEHPIVGHGFDMSRRFTGLIENAGRLDGLPILSLHPHNAGLHIWLETGFIGIILALITLYWLGRHILTHVRADRHYAVIVCGFMMIVTVIANISYGIWQEWWWASIIYASAFTTLNLTDNGREVTGG